MKSLNELVDKQLRQYGWLRRLLLFVAAAGGLLAGVLQIVVSTASAEAPPSFWLLGFQLLGVALAIVIPFLLACFDDTSADFVISANDYRNQRDHKQSELDALQRQFDALEAEYTYCMTMYQTASAMSELTDPLLLAEPEQREALRKTLVLSVLDRLIERQRVLFGTGDENWTFGVYRWSPDTQKLDMFATRRKSRESEDQEHRSWASSEGHVGQAFAKRIELVCADVNDPMVSGFVQAKGVNARSYDSSTYVSFASIPLRIGDADEPLGVLVATSSAKNRFVPAIIAEQEGLRDTIEPLRAAANTLATILGINHIDSTKGERSD